MLLSDTMGKDIRYLSRIQGVGSTGRICDISVILFYFNFHLVKMYDTPELKTMHQYCEQAFYSSFQPCDMLLMLHFTLHLLPFSYHYHSVINNINNSIDSYLFHNTPLLFYLIIYDKGKMTSAHTALY